MSAVTADPCARIVARLAADPLPGAGPPVAAGSPDGPGWVAGERVAPADLEHVMARLGAAWGTDDPRATGTVVLEHRLWAVAAPVVLAVLRERRAPDPAAACVTLRIDGSGVPAGVAFRGPVAVLRDDPWEARPGTVVLADEPALMAWLGNRLTDGHFAAVVAALAPLARRSPAALWASVHDGLSGLFAWIGDELGRGADGRRLAGLLLGVRAPLQAPPRYRDLVVGDRVVHVRDRIGCCQSFRTGDAACVDCPRTGDEERIRRLL